MTDDEFRDRHNLPPLGPDHWLYQGLDMGWWSILIVLGMIALSTGLALMTYGLIQLLT